MGPTSDVNVRRLLGLIASDAHCHHARAAAALARALSAQTRYPRHESNTLGLGGELLFCIARSRAGRPTTQVSSLGAAVPAPLSRPSIFIGTRIS